MKVWADGAWATDPPIYDSDVSYDGWPNGRWTKDDNYHGWKDVRLGYRYLDKTPEPQRSNDLYIPAIHQQPRGPVSYNWKEAPAGTQFIAGIGTACVLPDFDFETYSEAGYVWQPHLGKWGSLPGLSDQNRGLKAVGTRNYVEHPSFRILSLSWNLKDGKGERWWRPPEIEDLFNRPNGQYTLPHASGELCDYIANHSNLIEAWGVFFEWQVWNFYCVPKLGWPPLYQRQCRDGMAKARASGYPGSLDEVGSVLKLSQRKDTEGTRIMRKLSVPRKPTRGNPDLCWTPLTAREDFNRLYEYNKQDIRTEAEASVRIPDLTERELRIWQFDFRNNMRGMQINLAAVDDCIAIIEQVEAKGHAELRGLTNGAVSKHTEVQPMLSWMRTQGVYLYNLDEETLELALSRNDYPRNVLRVLRIRQMLAFGSVKKYYAMRAQTTPSGRLYDQYVFYGAHTSLWNGRGVQPANLYKGVFSKPEQVTRALELIRTRSVELLEYEYGEGSTWAKENGGPIDPLEVIASCIRSMICAKPGHKLISADFSAIQAVATSCMANEQWRIDVFRTHGKIYEAMASQLTGLPLEFYLDYRKTHGKHHEHRQTHGKIPVLSADFGAWIPGWKRFGAEKLGDDETLKRMILATRARIPNVVNFWGGQTINKFNRAPDGSYAEERQHLYGLEGAAISAILEPGKCFSNRPGSRLAVLYQVHEDTLYCRPPSGGYIRYHSPRLRKSERDYAAPWEYAMSYWGQNSNAQKGPIGWIEMDLYGGVQTQNVISHMCREIQADALLALEHNQPREYPVVMHTHDEGVAEVPDNPEWNANEYTEIVRHSLPAWAVCEDGQPWPIKVPLAWEAYMYGKWED